MDFIQIVLNAGLMVQFVLLLLLFFSITSWTIMILKFRYVRRAIAESTDFAEFFWKSRNLSEAFTKAKQLQDSPIARVFRIGYLETKRLWPAAAAGTADSAAPPSPSLNSTATVKRAMRRAINGEITRVTEMVPFLATTGNTTPFIGLFGTVWGIMNAFHGIGQVGSASLSVVAPGISEALIATAAGLAAAIPAVIAFNFFMHKIRIIESDLESFSADFLNILEGDILNAAEGR